MADKNGDNALDFDEIMKLLKILNANIKKKYVQIMFEVTDELIKLSTYLNTSLSILILKALKMYERLESEHISLFTLRCESITFPLLFTRFCFVLFDFWYYIFCVRFLYALCLLGFNYIY